MSTLQTANIWFESTGNNRIQSSGSNGVTIFAGGSNVATVNTTSFTISNTAYLVVGNSSVNTVVNSTTVAVGGVAVNAASLNPYQGYKNRIINGDMRVDQRGNSGASSITANAATRTYGPDRWAVQASAGGSRYFTMQQFTTSPPTGYSHYLRVSVAAAGTPSSSDFNFISQPIEGYMVADFDFGKATAKTITLSAWIRTSITGTFGGSILNYDSNRAYPFTYTISSANTWTQIIVTVPGDTTGSWPVGNGGSMFVIFDLGTGSTYKGTVNTWAASQYFGATTGTASLVGTLGATFELTGVQLEIGSSATLFDRRSYTQELQLCQRYCYTKSTLNDGVGAGIWYATTAVVVNVAFPVTMRAAPTLAGTFTMTCYYNGGSFSSAQPTLNTAGPTACELYSTMASGSTTAGYGTSARMLTGSMFLIAEL